MDRRYCIDHRLIPALTTVISDTGKEQCFVLLGHRHGNDIHVCGYLPVPNRAADPREDFAVEDVDIPMDLVPLVVGVAHTHLAGQERGPSYHDVQMMPRDQIGIVLHAHSRTAHIYDRDGYMHTVPFPLDVAAAQ